MRPEASGGGDAPDGDYVLPDYTLWHNDTAVSADGAPLTPLCAARYTTQMEAKATSMALQVDARIEDSLCPDIARGELYIRTTTVDTQLAGDQVGASVTGFGLFIWGLGLSVNVDLDVIYNFDCR